MSIKLLPKPTPKRPIYIIGLNSGTSADGIDLALVKFDSSKPPDAVICQSCAYSQKIKRRIISLAEPEFVTGDEWLALDSELGILYGKCVKRFITKIIKAGKSVDLVASHGQTIRHLPRQSGYTLTLQLGDPALIARISGLPVVSDFRRSDIASGGEGAPLSPILHEALFRSKGKWRAIVNIGGIANITILPPWGSRRKPLAADSGPGNMLIDAAMMKLFGKRYDSSGSTARQGKADPAFVSKILKNSFFRLSPPRSTGRELFGASFLEIAMSALRDFRPEDIIASLTEITVSSIADFIHKYGSMVDEIYLCGGGARNRFILKRLEKEFANCVVDTTAALGHDPDFLEAQLWAYLAYRFVSNNPVRAGNYTGARHPYIPGKLCLP